MKPINFSKTVFGTGLLALSLTLLPAAFPATAQAQTNDNPTIDSTPFQESTNDFNNLGWLGLIGLVGLANLFRKPQRQNNESYVSPDVTTTPRSTYRD